eukprot:gene6219-6456_t
MLNSPSTFLGVMTRSKSEKLVHSRLDSVLSSWEDDDYHICNSLSESSATPGSLPRQGSVPQTQCFVYKTAGLSVKLGLEEVASDLFRVKPYVFSAPDNTAVIVFSGFLQNLSEISRRVGAGRSGPSTPRFSDPNNASSLERKSSIERSRDLGALTASAVLQMYLDGREDGDELIMLSELQGEFAFVIYDNKHKQAFAARDPSGSETLYYHLAEDGALSFASSRMAVPEAEQPDQWRELPPGHYISGRHPKLHQFALTPQQLVMREMEEEDVLDCSRRRRSAALEPEVEMHLASQLRQRTSLDAAKPSAGSCSGRTIEPTGIFPFDL